MGRLFGTDGVRGVANTELTVELAYKLGRFGAHVITQGKERAKILIGKDTRVSGYMLESALVAGILSAGCDAICVGVTPTPSIAHLVKHFDADAGVVISASHNPVEYNGIKFFKNDGFKLSDEMEDQIADYILNDKDLNVIPTGHGIGRKSHHFEANRFYMDSLKKTISVDFKGLKVALDCANGAAFEVAPSLIRELGAEVVVMNNHPDGYNINVDCGSTHPDKISQFLRETHAQIGLAFDGDADRLIAVDENGDIVDGDKIMAICAKHMKSKGQLKNDTVVTTVMSNIGFDIALKENGLKSVKTKVGDRYVLEEMRAGGYSLGGEQSGHIIFLNHNTTGDGLLSAIQLLQVMKETGKPLSELAKIMTTYPQVLLNAKVHNGNKNKYMEDEVIVNRIKEVEDVMHGEGRVLIRPSGTEPLVRVMLEGKDQGQLDAFAKELVSLIEERL